MYKELTKTKFLWEFHCLYIDASLKTTSFLAGLSGPDKTAALPAPKPTQLKPEIRTFVQARLHSTCDLGSAFYIGTIQKRLLSGSADTD